MLTKGFSLSCYSNRGGGVMGVRDRREGGGAICTLFDIRGLKEGVCGYQYNII